MPSNVIQFFSFAHLPAGNLRSVSADVAELAGNMENGLPDGPEKSAGMRKLLEAKDCFVRAALSMPADSYDRPGPEPVDQLGLMVRTVRTAGALAMTDEEYRAEAAKDVGTIRVNFGEIRKKAGATFSVTNAGQNIAPQ